MLGSNSPRDKIFKSWTGISEVALIKEVATKGEHIDLCIEYWARKRKKSVVEYKLFFHDVVQTYVQRLLTERLVCKAENVLRNVQRDVRCCYFEFAMECEDEELRELVLEHVHKSCTASAGGNASSTDDILQELQFHWSLLKQIEVHPKILAKCKSEMPNKPFNLETMASIMKDSVFRKNLLTELYFSSGDESLLPQLSKYNVWQFLIETGNQVEIIRWCKISAEILSHGTNEQRSQSALDRQYHLWSPLEADMFEFAMRNLKGPNCIVRNFFAQSGYFFPDERDSVQKVLQRICTTESFTPNAGQLSRLPLGKYLLEQNNFILMLCDFVSIRELEELAMEYTDFEKLLLELVIALKTNDLGTREGFEKVFQATKTYLQSIVDNSSLSVEYQKPILALYDFLCHEPTINSLNCFLLSSALKRIPYLVSIAQRIESNGAGIQNPATNVNEQCLDAEHNAHQAVATVKHMPNAYELLRKFKNFDFKLFLKTLLYGSHGPSASQQQHQLELASFSNERLCERYARKYELNFLHYLKQQRSAYAVYYLLTTYLQSYAQITRPQLFSACETVSELALKHVNSPELVTHCVAFCEMLGFDTQPLRSMFKLIRLIDSSDETPKAKQQEQKLLDPEVFPIPSYSHLIKCVEKRLLKIVKSNYDGSKELLDLYEFPLEDYSAIIRLANDYRTKSSQQQEKLFPMAILRFYASENDWWRLLVLMQYFELPLDVIAHLLDAFEARQMGEHLLRALCHDGNITTVNERDSLNNAISVRRHASAQNRHRKNPTASAVLTIDGLKAFHNVMPPIITTSIETMGSSISSFAEGIASHSNTENDTFIKSERNHQLQLLNDLYQLKSSSSILRPNSRIDIFAVILWSSTNVQEIPVESLTKFLEIIQDNQLSTHPTSWNLLKFSIKYRMPILALLAATLNPLNVDYCWLVWLSIGIDQWQVILEKALSKNNAELSWLLIETAIKQGDVVTAYRSFCIFYEKNPLVYFLRFLYQTKDLHDFGEESVHNLRLYLLACSNNEVQLPFNTPMDIKNPTKTTATSHSESTSISRDQLMLRNVQLVLVHLQNNFMSSIEQQSFLSCVCRSDIGDICGGHLDFCLLNEVFAIIHSATRSRSPSVPEQKMHPTITINFERLLSHDSSEYEEVLNKLKEANAYDAAISLATLLHLPICDIVFSKWVAALNDDQQRQCEKHRATLLQESQSFKNKMEENELLAQYEAEIVEHALPPDVLVNFFLYAASNLDECQALRKFNLLQRALNVIKKNHLFPSECFDRDQIEYEMIICYLHIDEVQLPQASIYHSEYYEQIMIKERRVLYKSFLELKELAGIEDLNMGMKTPLTDAMQERLERLLYTLLDEGDIVEALRLQELFDCRPIDLRFIVFCMALAEGVTTIFSMSSEERQLLRDVEKSAFAKFNRRTLSTTLRSSPALISGIGGTAGSQSNQPYSTSPLRSSLMHESDEFSDSCSMLEFEEIPSKEKRETLDTIQGIASKLKHGIDLGKRIVMAYRAAMYLDKEYLDVLRTKDASILLKSVAEEGCLHRLLVVSDILTSTQMTPDEIAELLSYEITTAIVRPRFYIFNTDQQQAKNSFKNSELWGYNIDRDLHLFLELTPNTTKLGNALLDYCDALKAYRKYQDNKPYEHNASFEKLAEIISIYGLPRTQANSVNKIGSMGAAVVAAVSVAPVNIIGGIQISQNDRTTPPPPQVLSHKKQNLIYVELLIKAHQCFVHECSMEGIANVLNRAKALNVVLTNAKSWSLMVRMLIGIARYREMYYCFSSLIENEQFESLLGQFEEEKTVGLRQAILCYLREYEPPNSRELLKLAALHFLMYKDLAEMWEHDAQMILAKVLANSNGVSGATGIQQTNYAMVNDLMKTGPSQSIYLRCNTDVLTMLQQALENYTHATENYLFDNKLLLAQKTAAWAELVAMQIDLMNKRMSCVSSDRTTSNANTTSKTQLQCVCVLNVQSREEFRELVNAELSVPQSLILQRAYGYDINWTEALLSQYILLTRKQYLRDYLAYLSINDNIIENIIKGFQRYMQNNHRSMSQMEENLANLLTFVRSVTLKYKLASLLSQKSIVMSLINEQTIFYLKDTNYGRNENNNMPDI